MSLFAPPPKPKSLLGFHRVLSPSAGVRVSPLCLGAMNFGDAWEAFMGKCDKKNTYEMLDFFYENGGNFIDTANNYQNEESETWIGDWMKERGNRDEMVIATKFTTMYRGGGHEKIKANFQGQTHKSLRLSLEASLEKLQTSYIDVLYIHWWDFTTSIPEVMQSLASVVREGKVLYLGISDTPAWIVSKANQYARDHALPQFVVYQGQWSAAMRDFEREIIPMCREEGMALAPWGALGGGNFKTEEQRKSDEGRKFGPPSENHLKISKVLEGIANKRKTIITSVALAYVMHKAPYVFPIVGGRNTKHLQGNIDALGLELSTEELDEIDDATNFDLGFPMNMLFSFGGQKYNSRMTSKDIPLLKSAVYLDTPQHQQPIKPHSVDATEAADR